MSSVIEEIIGDDRTEEIEPLEYSAEVPVTLAGQICRQSRFDKVNWRASLRVYERSVCFRSGWAPDEDKARVAVQTAFYEMHLEVVGSATDELSKIQDSFENPGNLSSRALHAWHKELKEVKKWYRKTSLLKLKRR